MNHQIDDDGTCGQMLSRSELRFVAEYCSNGFNATKAYQFANPTSSTAIAAVVNGHQGLKNSEVQDFIDEFCRHSVAGCQAKLKKRIADILEARAFYDISDILDESGNLVASFDELDERGLTVCIDYIAKSVGKLGEEHFEYHLADKAKAIDQLRSILGDG